MKRLPLLLLCALLMGQTGYESAIQALPPGTIGGGCPNIGRPNAEQAALRDGYHSTFGWPILTTDAADRVAAFIGNRDAVDFGAGAGYFAHLLAERGVNVLAIDDWSWGKPPVLWHPVEAGGYELLEGTSDRVLVLSWPTRQTGMATAALEAWGGSRLVYAGEILRGAAEPSFFRELADSWRLVERIDIPQWHNRSDAVWLFERGHGDGWDWMTTQMRNCKDRL